MEEKHDCTCCTVNTKTNCEEFKERQEMDQRGTVRKIDEGVEGTPPSKKARFEYEYPPPPPAPVERKKDVPSYEPIRCKPYHEMTDDELWLSISASRGGKVSIDTVMDKIPKLRKYFTQLEESDGYDLDENPGVDLPPASIMKYGCCRKCYPQDYDKYMNLAQYAIDETYNKDNKTEYKVLEVNSVNATYCLAEAFYLTFTAAEDVGPACKKTFQAKVCTWFTYGKKDEKFQKVKKCRVKG